MSIDGVSIGSVRVGSDSIDSASISVSICVSIGSVSYNLDSGSVGSVIICT